MSEATVDELIEILRRVSHDGMGHYKVKCAEYYVTADTPGMRTETTGYWIPANTVELGCITHIAPDSPAT
jgi:hypothetical protein